MLDSGAMYRAVTLMILQQNNNPNDEAVSAAAAEQAEIKFVFADKQLVLLNNVDVTDAIRTPEVTRNIAPVAANPSVRTVLVEKQRRLGESGGVVAEGRDIGTVVFPKAELKVFMQASIKERAKRRQAQLQSNGTVIDLEELEKDIRLRDESDMQRQFGALKQAQDAIVVDTSKLALEEQVDIIVKEARKRGA
jgi:cytidylate kinase